MKTKPYFIFIGIPFAMLLNACEKWVEIGAPENQLTPDIVFSDTTTLNGAIGEMYANLDRSINVAHNKYLGIYTDELNINSTNRDVAEFYAGRLSPTNTYAANIWTRFYFSVYQANDIIEQLGLTTAIPQAIVDKSIAQAKFIRAFSFYHLFNCYGDIPVILTTDVKVSSVAARSDSVTVFNQILEDLNHAEVLLADLENSVKTSVSKWAVKALKAKVLLHQGKWQEAELTSSEIIESGVFDLDDLNNVFRSTGTEAIFHVWTQNGFIADGPSLIPSSGIPAQTISQSLLEAFEQEDKRRESWIGVTNVNGTVYHYPFKYRNRSSGNADPEYLSVFRLAEQYLIRAESRANQGNIPQAVADLNTIRQRAGLNPLSNLISGEQCLAAIEKERRTELFVEWGQRFTDLKRTGSINAVMSAAKASWTSSSVYLPIPLNEITYNRNLNQNPGY